MRLRLLVLVVVIAAPAPAVASASTFSPARFVVSGKPLVGKTAGRSVSVFAHPAAVTVDGCRSHGAKVHLSRKGVSLSVALVCRGRKGKLRLLATIRGAHLDGVLTYGRSKRHFTARRVQPKGVVLHGRAKARALTVMPNTNKLVRHGASELSRVGQVQVARTEIDLLLTRGARVRDVNKALSAVGGRIMGSVRGEPLVVVSIPDPGDVKTLDKLRAMLLRMPGVARADRAVLAAQSDELPAAFSSPPTTGQLNATQHLLALQMPAAWNARAAIQMAQRPLLIVLDEFGAGPLDPHVDAVNSGPLPITGKFSNHGYHVVGIAAGDFGDDGTSPGLVTGVFPATTDLFTLDKIGLTPVEGLVALELEVLQASRTNAHLVVNTSQNFLGSTNALILAAAESWTALVHDNGLDAQLVQASSAGNQSVNATLNSAWNASVLASPLLDPSTGQPMAPLKQTLVVEDLDSAGAPSFAPGCIDSFSDTGGNVSAVGENVYSMLAGPTAGRLSGTSMSTPQIAALAEYLWSIAPDLNAQEITRAIIQTAPPRFSCQSAAPANAYAATLSLDHPGTPSKTNTPVRFAILDDNNDGKFDETDVIALAKAIAAPSHPGVRDWSREDLNGDGFTGGSTTAPFDLDTSGSVRAGAPHLSTVTENVNGASVSFDETDLTDTQILCYYAYSPLYTGSTTIRDANLRSRCLEAPIVFDSNRNGSMAVWSISHDGSGATELAPSANLSGPPSLSSDASKIVFTSGAAFTLTTMNVDGSAQTTVSGAGKALSPSWSPDGKQIVFIALQPGSPSTQRVAVINADGSGFHQLTSDVASDSFPAFSPDGTKIAYGLQGDIWVMNADGSNQHDVTNTPISTANEDTPDWSPDGSQILDTRSVNSASQEQIAIMNANGAAQHALLNTTAIPYPAFSPDGTQIVYNDLPSGASHPHLFVANSNGSGATDISGATTGDLEPEW